jgi:hypothetical protein
MNNRDDLLRDLSISTRLRYPLRWADDQTSLGDFDGRDLAIDVFNIPSQEQRAFFRDLRSIRKELQQHLGHTVTFVFHTPEATAEYYAHLFSKITDAALEGGITIKLSPGGLSDSVGCLNFELAKAA